MAVTVIGNQGPGYRSQGPFGIGGRHSPIVGSWCAVAGEIGDVKAFSSLQVMNRAIQIGIYVQATDAVSLRYSLAGPEETLDPNLSSSAPWTNPQTLTTRGIVATSAPIWAAVEITFTKTAIVYFYGR